MVKIVETVTVERSILTPRQLEVFRLIGEGWSTVDIAGRLELSPKTIETHRENIKRKLDFQDNLQLIVEAVKFVNGIE